MFTCEAVSKAAKPSDIEALAEKLEPALARAVRDLIKDHVARVDLDALEDALKNGRTYQVMEIIGEVDPQKAQAVRDALQNAVWQGGALAVTQSPVLNEARFAFNRLNPALITWLEGYSLNLIRDIGEGTRAAVRSALVDGMTKGVNPIQQARQIKQAVGLTEAQARAVQNYRRALETVHERRSLKSWGLGNQRSKQSGVEIMPVDAKGKPKDGINQWRLRDQRYDNAIRRAQENRKPLTPEQIDRQVDRYQERMIQNRARTIARAESMRALGAGTTEAWRQAVEERKVDGDRVRKFIKDAKTERECEECRSLARNQPKRGIPMNAEWVSKKTGRSYRQTPIHPNCLCVTFYRYFEPEQLLDEAA